MRIKNVLVEGLFDIFDYPIPLNVEEGITIIHGPNGCGKTTVLRMIKNLFSKEFAELSRVPFARLLITFSDNTQLLVNRLTPTSGTGTSDLRAKRPASTDVRIEFDILTDDDVKPWTWLARGHHLIVDPADAVDSQLPHLVRVEDNMWVDPHTEEHFAIEELVARYPLIARSRFRGQDIPAWLTRTIDEVPVHFIQTQRLLRLGDQVSRLKSRKHSHRAMVLEYAEDLQIRMQSALAESAQQSQNLDRSFPYRVLTSARAPESTDEIYTRYEQQQAKRKRLIAGGLIVTQAEFDLPTRILDDAERRILSLYLDDSESKLSTFDLLLRKLEMLTDMISSRFLLKRLAINRAKGFVFTNTKTELPVPLEALSSGEQHELILAYELLFRVRTGATILIDEPELSLHVGWQHKFLEDLKQISDISGLHFLVATHSPQIVHKRWDLAVALAGGVQ
jgi:predicted ATP-binding protein involved in virulence